MVIKLLLLLRNKFSLCLCLFNISRIIIFRLNLMPFSWGCQILITELLLIFWKDHEGLLHVFYLDVAALVKRLALITLGKRSFLEHVCLSLRHIVVIRWLDARILVLLLKSCVSKSRLHIKVIPFFLDVRRNYPVWNLHQMFELVILLKS